MSMVVVPGVEVKEKGEYQTTGLSERSEALSFIIFSVGIASFFSSTITATSSFEVFSEVSLVRR